LLSTRPVGYAKQFNASGLITYASKSIMKTLPLQFSIEVSPKGPLSVKNKESYILQLII
jgi:hypothetical protein